MTTVPHAHTHARTEIGSETPRGGGFQVYPNRRGKPRDDDNRGALRVGIVEENAVTEDAGLAGFLAAVTYEEHGEVWFYVWQTGMWIGPHWALSEEIVPMES